MKKAVYIRLNTDEEVEEYETFKKNQKRKGATVTGVTKRQWREDNEKELNK